MSKWSQMQSLAIARRSSHLLVSAGAGSGKTTVLVERVLRRILDEGVQLNQILIVTFTEAAAAEMKERIAEALYDASKGAQSSRATSQILLLEQAQISTLHSFCLNVLRLGALDLHISPGFRIADGNESKMILNQVLEEWLSEWLQIHEEKGITFALRYGDVRGDQNLRRWLKQIYLYARSQPHPERFLDDMRNLYEENAGKPLQDMLYADLYSMRIQRVLHHALDLYRQGIQVCDHPGGSMRYQAHFTREVEMIEEIMRLTKAKKFTELASLRIEFERLPADKEADEDLKKKAQTLRDKAKKIIAKLYLEDRSVQMLQDEVISGVPDVQLIVQMVKEFSVAYKEKKKDAGIVDFQDLEHMALVLLQGTTLQNELVLRYKEIMVDEYQDTSPLQDAILGTLDREGGPAFFLVGDVKQSIYRFRMAEPELFIQKSEVYQKSEDVINMNENYRSRKQIVSAVNAIFSQIFTEDLSGIAYDDKAEMKAFANYPETENVETLMAPVEIHLVESGDFQALEDEDQENSEHMELSDQEASQLFEPEADNVVFAEDLLKIEREAVVIVKRIQELMQKNPQVYDSHLPGYRTLEYRDFAILLRSDQGRIDALFGVLRKAGIPVAGNADSGFFSGYEILLALSLLQIIDNPRQDIALVSVLRSNICKMTATELAFVRLRERGSFLDALKKFVSLPPEDSAMSGWEKGRDFLRRLDLWRKVARTWTLPDAVEYILRDSGLLKYFRMTQGGSIRKANLSFLEKMASVFANVHGNHFRSFVRYLEEHMKNSDLDLGGAAVFAENENVVRIMTIHKSKGLEFPVVFLAGLGNLFNTRYDSPIYLHREYGFGLKMTDLTLRERKPTVTSMALQELDEQESLAEEARVLYVAMTRARERLILIASQKKVRSVVEDWEDRMRVLRVGTDKLPDYMVFQAKGFLDWILPAMWMNKEYEQIFKWQIWDQAAHFIGLMDQDEEDEGTVRRFVQMDRNLFADDLAVNGISIQDVEQDILNAQWNPVLTEEMSLRSKVSVTEWKKMSALPLLSDSEPDEDLVTSEVYQQKQEWIPERPKFLQKQSELTPAEKGTLFHKFMQHINLSDCMVEAVWFKEELQRLVDGEVFSGAEAREVSWEGAYHFFSSPLGLRMWNKRHTLKREVPFTLSVSPSILLNKEQGGKTDFIVVQGMVDSAFEEDGEYVIIDYKTDQISQDIEDQELVKKYELQLQLYIEALTKGWRKPVKEAWLYFVHTGRQVRVHG